jgi:acyl carrier protein phosphodiesterase
MNFLAHLKLSGDHEKIMLGNFIADHIRGNKIHHFPQEIIDGIMLHRKIDYYTDHHPAFIQTRTRLHKKYHKYAGVIADIFYDHFLARNWDDYSEISLSHFTSYSYGVLLRNYTILPRKTKQLLPFIIMQNWLASYGKFDGLTRAFDMMSRRAKNKSNMEFAVHDLRADYDLYQADFERFFPDIAAFCENELAILFPGEKWENKNRIIKTAKLELIIKERELEKKKSEEAQKKKELKELVKKAKEEVKEREKALKRKEKAKAKKEKELKEATKLVEKDEKKKAKIKTKTRKKTSTKKEPNKKVKAVKKLKSDVKKPLKKEPVKTAKKKKSTTKAKTSKTKKIKNAASDAKKSTYSRIKAINEFTDKNLESLKELSKSYIKRIRTSKYLS